MPAAPAAECARLIREARQIGVLTGAGISTSAGIPDFRGPRGLYVTRQYDPDKVFDIRHFIQDPVPFYEFARDFLGLSGTLHPTPAHFFLARLENLGQLAGIVTQNIDGFHHQAGSQNVFEMHGSFLQSFCLECRKPYSLNDLKEFLARPDAPRCSCNGLIKPDIVFFGEDVKYLRESEKLAEGSDLFFVIGSSCVVYPAAVVPTLCRGKIIIVNHDPVDIHGDIVLQVNRGADDFFNEVASILEMA